MTNTYLPLLNLLDRKPWTEQALCARSADSDTPHDPDAVFPVKHPKASDPVILTCRACPVSGHCAAEALIVNESWGIRAGYFINGRMSTEQRDALVAIADTEGVIIPDAARTKPSRPVASVNHPSPTHCKGGHEASQKLRVAQ